MLCAADLAFIGEEDEPSQIVQRLTFVGLNADSPPIVGAVQKAQPRTNAGPLRRLQRSTTYVDLGRLGHGVDGEVVVNLARPASQNERASLERALSAWSKDGVAHGFGVGYLHGFAPESHWSESTLRWRMDFGSADVPQAANELARRLAGWSGLSGVDVASLRFGS
jgi:hypothetical protein